MKGQLRLWEPEWFDLLVKIKAEANLPWTGLPTFNGKPWPGR